MPHNLKTYLALLANKDGDNPETHEYFVGRRFNSGGSNHFNSGGAGYSLLQATLHKLLATINDTEHSTSRERVSMEHVMITRCLRHIDIHFTDTRDTKGRERFHPFSPGQHLHLNPPKPGATGD